MFRRFCLVCSIICVFSCNLIKAEVVYELQPGSNATSVIDQTWKFGQSFVNSSQTGILEFIKVSLSKQGTLGGNLNLNIYSANGSSGNYTPNTTTLISSSSLSAGSIGAKNFYEFTGFSGQALTSGGSYVFVLDFSSVTGLNGSNFINVFQGTGSGIGVSGQNAVTNTAGSWNPDNTYNYAAIVSVPEPGTLLLASLAAASGGCGVWWKRRRKKVLAASDSGELV